MAALWDRAGAVKTVEKAVDQPHSFSRLRLEARQEAFAPPVMSIMSVVIQP